MMVYSEKPRNLCKKTVAFHTLGCKVNAYETEVMEKCVREAGAEVVPFTEKADIYVINTCSVTNIADRKSRQMLSRARKMNPDALIVAAGCYSQIQKDRGNEEAVGADLIIGNGEKGKIAERIAEYLESRQQHEITPVREEKAIEELTLDYPSGHTRAYLKVQDGCSQFCAYCIIPFARGPVRSRSTEDVVEEVKTLLENGVKEFVVTGIHLSSYGLPAGMVYNEYIKTHPVQEPLLELLRAISAVPGEKRIRLGSLEPRLITENFASELAEIKEICPQFHLSLQSGCNETLKRMNRHYTTDEYLNSCRILKKYIPGCALTTDVIAGFPGETEEEFAETVSFLKAVGFYELHVFPYSRRKGTVADRLPDQVDPEIKKQRADVLLKLSDEFRDAFEKAMDGKYAEALTEELTETQSGRFYTGYTREYVRVLIPETAGVNRIVSGTFVKDDENRLKID